MITNHIWTTWAGMHMSCGKSTICAVCVGTTWWRTTTGTIGAGPADDTGFAETGATTGGRSGGGAGAVDWWYINKPVRGTRSMIVLDGSYKKMISSKLCGGRQPSGRQNWRFDKPEIGCSCKTSHCEELSVYDLLQHLALAGEITNFETGKMSIWGPTWCSDWICRTWGGLGRSFYRLGFTHCTKLIISNLNFVGCY